jgi:3-hydroxybutyryl-CoA dehydratase
MVHPEEAAASEKTSSRKRATPMSTFIEKKEGTPSARLQTSPTCGPRPWRREVAEGVVGVGKVVRFSRTFTEEDVKVFGQITRDYNPVHYEPRFAREKGFSGLICHGLLVGSMICEPGGQWAWLASAMSFRFIKPVYIGDTITCEMEIVEIDQKGKALAIARFTNQRGELVMEAELRGFLPGPKEREVLWEMISEGDPTNPIGGG